jgi:ferrous iron transport protein A
LGIILSEMDKGQSGIVKDLRGGRTFVSRMTGLGFTIGTEVTMVQNLHRGPVVVMVRATRVALGRGEAMRVRVEVHRHDS